MSDFSRNHEGTRVCFGAGASKHLRRELSELGAERVAVLCTVGRKALAERIAIDLGGLSVGIVAEAQPHVPIRAVEAAQRAVDATGADTVLSVGGGSSIGLGKALAQGSELRLAALPTTYSGSEMTNIYGISDGEEKRTGRDEKARARLVVYDPDLLRELPIALTVPSLFNAMAHAVEALYSPELDPVTQTMACAAIRELDAALAQLQGASVVPEEVRVGALYGAHLAGCCLSSASMGLHHKLCHVLGGKLGLPHAETHTAMLPQVARFNAVGAPDALGLVADALGTTDAAAAIYDRIVMLDGPRALRALGLRREDIPSVADAALEHAYPNPRPASRDELMALLEDAYHGHHPTKRGAPLVFSGTRTPVHSEIDLEMMSGFGNAHASEALPGSLPERQNSPHHAPKGLYAEQLNATPFTMRRALNRRTWMYRIRPSVTQSRLDPVRDALFTGAFESAQVSPNLARWHALPIPPADQSTDWLDGLMTFGGCGSPDTCRGFAIHLYAANTSMTDRAFYNSDGDLLLVPEVGALLLTTELGRLTVAPGEIAIIGRGIKFSVALLEPGARGFVLEVYDGPLRLPERGMMGANGLADERHFFAPTAWYEDREAPGYELMVKHGGHLFRGTLDHSPFDVVAWHGNHAPFKYNLAHFNTYGSVTWDHPDPSILTLLTCPMDEQGRSAVDFAVFAGRWDVAEHTFRPPFYHRNAATEFNAILRTPEEYAGFEKGSCYLSPTMTPHGINAASYARYQEMSDEQAAKPHRIPDESLWIMFESAYTIRLTDWARNQAPLDPSFGALFSGMKKYFDPTS